MPSRSAVTYGVAKELASIICPLVGQSPYHIKNTLHFMEQIRSLKLQQGECMFSYDVKTLFTLAPVDPVICIVKSKLLQDPLLSHRTSISIPQIITLLEVCLKIPTSSSRVSILSRFMVKPWVVPLAP